jgi:hypothetical protein
MVSRSAAFTHDFTSQITWSLSEAERVKAEMSMREGVSMREGGEGGCRMDGWMDITLMIDNTSTRWIPRSAELDYGGPRSMNSCW